MSDERSFCPYLIGLNYGTSDSAFPERMCVWYEIELITHADGRTGGVNTYDQFLLAIPGRVYIRHPGMIVHGFPSYTFQGVLFDSFYDEGMRDYYAKYSQTDALTCTSYDFPFLKAMQDRDHMCALLDEMPPCIDVEDISRYYDCYTRLIKLYIEKPPHMQLLFHREILRIVCFLIEDMNRQKETDYFDTHTRDLVLRIRDYMYRNYQERVSLEDIAREFSISREYICRLFKRYLRISPMDYLNSVRLFYAQQLLVYGELSVEQIASQCGFSSTQYFYTVYRRTYGTSPRKQNRPGG